MNKYELNGQWALSFTHPTENRKIETIVDVPCNVEPYLVKLGLLEDYMPADDPYVTQPFEAVDDWTYVKRFDAPELISEHTARLVLEGIDTVAEVYLNGALLLNCENMHLRYSADVTTLLRPLDNELKVVIRSSELYARKHLHDMRSYSRDAVTTYDSQSFLRKPRHQWGWDNAPRLLSSGIVRDVYIEQLPPKRFEEIYVYTDKITDNYVILGASWKYITSEKSLVSHRIRVTLLDGDRVIHTQDSRALFVQGSFKFIVDRKAVKLWWPCDMGEPYLYTVKLEMLNGDQVEAEQSSTLGIRTLTLNWSEYVTDGDGEFSFVVNGERVHIRGTNWKPLDPLASLADKKLCEERALEEIRALNCNMVRIWGGGIYEDEHFFDYCDKNGIMIWQDFMFACEVPPNDSNYCELVAREAAYVVKKYRNHPSLAVWCGDNESDEAMCWGGLNTTALPSDSLVSRRILKDAVLCNDPYRVYLPSSPFVSDLSAKEFKQGLSIHCQTEKHLYADLVDQPRALRQCKSIFLGETGPFWTNAMSPSPAILTREATRCERLWNEPVEEPPVRKEVIFHQDDYYFKMWRQSGKRACEAFYGRDFDFSQISDFTLALNLLCAEVFKDLIEYCRVSRPQKTGVIWWSLMDMFPMLFNYSVIDSDYNRKLPYYWIRQSQQAVAVMAVRKELSEAPCLYIANGTLSDRRVEYTVTAYGADLKPRTVATGVWKQAKNSVSPVQWLSHSDSPEMWLIRWSDGENCGVNHFFTSKVEYSVMRSWIELLEGQLAPKDGFGELKNS